MQRSSVLKPVVSLIWIALAACGSREQKAKSTVAPVAARKLAANPRPERIRVVDVRVGQGNGLVTEASFCAAKYENEACVNQAIVQSTADDGTRTVFRYAENHFVRIDDPAARAEADAEVDRLRIAAPGGVSRETFAVDFDRLDNVLRKEFFFSIYRCRQSPAVRYARERGSLFSGNYLIYSGQFFDVERRSSFVIGLELDRTSRRFLGAAIHHFVDRGAKVIGTESASVGRPSWSLVTNVPIETNVVSGTALPRGLPVGGVRAQCGLLYEEYLNRPSKVWSGEVDRMSDVEKARELYLPVPEPRFENDAQFNLRAEIDLSENFVAEFLKHPPAYETVWITDRFLDDARFPKFDFASDAFWKDLK